MKKAFMTIFTLLMSFILLGCNPASSSPVSSLTSTSSPSVSLPLSTPGNVSVKLVNAYPKLTFDKPLEYVSANDGTGRIFVVEKSGKIKVFQNDPQTASAQVFIDLGNLVDSASSEKGLLGLALHPDFKNNGYFYVNYTNKTDTVIARYQTDPADPSRGLKDSGALLLTFPQPYANHNGGRLSFGPDGYLYIGVGDGGSAGDPQNNAQDRSRILGKILRIDVDKTNGDKLYGIPPDNPYTGNTDGYLEEIYAYGLRNPWKFSFDLPRGLFWVADVGQNAMEEIDLVTNGGNYGWNLMEGTLNYPALKESSQPGLIPPVWEYRHPTGESITGGYVYYGTRIPSLRGAYIYGDYVTGKIWALWLDSDRNPDNRQLLDTSLGISSFGVDQNNEIHIVDLNGGKIYIFSRD